MTKYWISFERPTMKMWRGHKVPFILSVRLHWRNTVVYDPHTYTVYEGSKIWFNLWGPNFFEWAKENR